MTSKTKLQAVIEFYTAQLYDLDLEVSGTGMVNYTDKDGNQKPVTITGDRLCLPTAELLKEGNWDQRVVYHPLSEQFGNSLSPIMNALKQYIYISLTTKYTQLILAMAELAADPTRHKRLGASVGKTLGSLGDFDEKTASAVAKLVKRVLDKPETRLVNILMRPGTGEKALRSTVITFPMTEALMEADRDGNTKPLDLVTLRKADLPKIRKLFQLFTHDGESKVFTSDDRTAPYYHSLLHAWMVLATDINGWIELLGPKVPAVKKIKPYELEWVKCNEDGEDDFAKFAAKHHTVANPLPGNRPVCGEVTNAEPPFETVVAKGKQVFENDQIPREQSVERDVPEDTRRTTDRGRSLDDFLSTRQSESSGRESIYRRNNERPRNIDRGIRGSSTTRKTSIDDFSRDRSFGGGRGRSSSW